MNFPIDPSLDRDNWAELARHRPDAFLHALVTALSAPNPVSVTGPSVEEAFRAHLASLTPNPKNNAMPSIPALYSILKTFWLPSSPSYFSLTASNSRSTPSEHRFLYWDPQSLVFNGIACPVCAAPLHNKGRIASGPVKIYDLGKPFFIIGCEYVCRAPACLPPGAPGDGRRFASTDTSILRALPTKLRDEFPARLIQGAGPTPDMGPGADVWSWRGMGVSTALWDMVRAALRSGVHKDVVLGIVHAVMQGLPDEPWVVQPLDMDKKLDELEGSEGGENDASGITNEGEEGNIQDDPNKEVRALAAVLVAGSHSLTPCTEAAGRRIPRGLDDAQRRARSKRQRSARSWAQQRRRHAPSRSTPARRVRQRVHPAAAEPVHAVRVPAVWILPPAGAPAAPAAAERAEAHVRARRRRGRRRGARAAARAALRQVRLERVQGQGRAHVLREPVPGLREDGLQGPEQQAAGQDVCGRLVAGGVGVRDEQAESPFVWQVY